MQDPLSNFVNMPEYVDQEWDDIVHMLWNERQTFRQVFGQEYDNHFNEIFNKYMEARKAGKDPLWYWRVADVPDVYLNLNPWNSLLLL